MSSSSASDRVAKQVAEDLAEAGLDVVGIDAELVGGECPYWGCIPSKMMVRAAELLAEGRRIPGRAGSSSSRRTGRRWPPASATRPPTRWDDRVAVDASWARADASCGAGPA